MLTTNSAWGGGTALANAMTTVGAFALPANCRDAAVLLTFHAGTYTAEIESVSGTSSGTMLLEVYDADAAANARLVDLALQTTLPQRHHFHRTRCHCWIEPDAVSRARDRSGIDQRLHA